MVHGICDFGENWRSQISSKFFRYEQPQRNRYYRFAKLGAKDILDKSDEKLLSPPASYGAWPSLTKMMGPKFGSSAFRPAPITS